MELCCYIVTLRNELTGEGVDLSLLDTNPGDAQLRALRYAFRELGWRKTNAQEPVIATEMAAELDGIAA